MVLASELEAARRRKKRKRRYVYFGGGNSFEFYFGYPTPRLDSTPYPSGRESRLKTPTKATTPGGGEVLPIGHYEMMQFHNYYDRYGADWKKHMPPYKEWAKHNKEEALRLEKLGFDPSGKTLPLPPGFDPQAWGYKAISATEIGRKILRFIGKSKSYANNSYDLAKRIFANWKGRIASGSADPVTIFNDAGEVIFKKSLAAMNATIGKAMARDSYTGFVSGYLNAAARDWYMGYQAGLYDQLYDPVYSQKIGGYPRLPGARALLADPNKLPKIPGKKRLLSNIPTTYYNKTIDEIIGRMKHFRSMSEEQRENVRAYLRDLRKRGPSVANWNRVMNLGEYYLNPKYGKWFRFTQRQREAFKNIEAGKQLKSADFSLAVRVPQPEGESAIDAAKAKLKDIEDDILGQDDGPEPPESGDSVPVPEDTPEGAQPSIHPGEGEVGSSAAGYLTPLKDVLKKLEIALEQQRKINEGEGKVRSRGRPKLPEDQRKPRKIYYQKTGKPRGRVPRQLTKEELAIKEAERLRIQQKHEKAAQFRLEKKQRMHLLRGLTGRDPTVGGRPKRVGEWEDYLAGKVTYKGYKLHGEAQNFQHRLDIYHKRLLETFDTEDVQFEDIETKYKKEGIKAEDAKTFLGEDLYSAYDLYKSGRFAFVRDPSGRPYSPFKPRGEDFDDDSDVELDPEYGRRIKGGYGQLQTALKSKEVNKTHLEQHLSPEAIHGLHQLGVLQRGRDKQSGQGAYRRTPKRKK